MFKNYQKFDLDHLDDLVKALDDLDKDLETKLATLERRLEEVSHIAYELQLMNVNDFMGELKRDAYVDGSMTSNTSFLIKIGNKSKHAVYVEYGTGLHRGGRESWIVPKRLLPDADRAIETYGFEFVGYGNKDGEPLYRVYGQRPKYFLTNTYLEISAVLSSIVSEVFKW